MKQPLCNGCKNRSKTIGNDVRKNTKQVPRRPAGKKECNFLLKEIAMSDEKKSASKPIDLGRKTVKAFCTYCSHKGKNCAVGNMPAIERYRNPRINNTYFAAMSSRAQFFILSGKYGLLRPCDPIPYYDHRLERPEVEALTKCVARQLRRYAINRLVYFTKSWHKNEDLKPYYEVIRRACDGSKVALVTWELPD